MLDINNKIRLCLNTFLRHEFSFSFSFLFLHFYFFWFDFFLWFFLVYVFSLFLFGRRQKKCVFRLENDLFEFEWDYNFDLLLVLEGRRNVKRTTSVCRPDLTNQ